jgi:hypothetical protein
MAKRTIVAPLGAVAVGLIALVALAPAPIANAAAASPKSSPPGLITWCEPGGSIPCLAPLQHPPVTYYGHYGGTETFPSNDLVEISCYYFGSPVVHGDNVEDHVVALATISGPEPLNGHVADWDVNLGGKNPWQVGIPAC